MKRDEDLYMTCPECKKTLERIDSKQYACTSCRARYKRYNCSPVLLENFEKAAAFKPLEIAMLPSVIIYHLTELEIQNRNVDETGRVLLSLKNDHNVILDIGCGIGQSFVSAGLAGQEGRTLIGIDIDRVSLEYGQRKFDNVIFINAAAEHLPLQSDCVDFALSRVTLPYTDIPLALTEIYRVLRKGGTVHFTLHSFDFFRTSVGKSLLQFSIKSLLDKIYVLSNGLVFHFTGYLYSRPIIGGKESIQTTKSIQTLLCKIGFVDIEFVSKQSKLLVTASKGLDF